MGVKNNEDFDPYGWMLMAVILLIGVPILAFAIIIFGGLALTSIYVLIAALLGGS